MKLFEGGKAPLFRLIKDDKTSHIFGSCHIVPLYNLSLRPLFDFSHSKNHKPDFIVDFLKNRKTLITEPGNIFEGRLLHLEDRFNFQGMKDIVNERDIYKRIGLISNKRQGYSSNLNFSKFLLGNDKLIEILKDKNIRVRELMEIIYIAYNIHGIDCSLISHYVEKDRKVYGLDSLISEDMKRYSQKYVNRSKILVFSAAFILSKLRKENSGASILKQIDFLYEDIVHDYLYLSWDHKEQKERKRKDNGGYIVTERDKQWLPHIIKYHQETEDPLFVVGEMHLPGLIGLLRRERFNIQVYDLSVNAFSTI